MANNDAAYYTPEALILTPTMTICLGWQGLTVTERKTPSVICPDPATPGCEISTQPRKDEKIDETGLTDELHNAKLKLVFDYKTRETRIKIKDGLRLQKSKLKESFSGHKIKQKAIY